MTTMYEPLEETTALAKRDFTLPTTLETQDQLSAIKAFQEACQRHMVPGHDYGVIPGTAKPTLLKPGAEKLVRLLGLADEYQMEAVKNWDKPFFHFQATCYLRHLASGQVVSTGVGECNSMEARYRWRQAKRQCPACGAEAIIKGKEEYGGGWICFKRQDGCGAKFNDDDARVTGQDVGRVENDDIYSQVNTILKMAKKRALVDAALSAGRLSDVFTQDMEDLAASAREETDQDLPQRQPAQRAGQPPAPRQQTGGKLGNCQAHSRPWAPGPEGRIGHPLGDGEWCWKDEQGDTEPTADPVEALQQQVAALGWEWTPFQEEVLGRTWAEFEELGGNPATALARLKNYEAARQGEEA